MGTVANTQSLFEARILASQIVARGKEHGFVCSDDAARQLETALNVFIAASKPFTHRAKERHNIGPNKKIDFMNGELLFLPMGWNRFGERGWLITGVNTVDHVRARSIDYMPPAESYITNPQQFRSNPAKFLGMSTEERTRRLVNGDFWENPTRHLSPQSFEKVENLAYLFDVDKAIAPGDEARKIAARLLHQIFTQALDLDQLNSPFALFTPDVSTQFSPVAAFRNPDQYQRDYEASGGISFVERHVDVSDIRRFRAEIAEILKQWEARQCAPKIDQWVEDHLGDEVALALQETPGQQTTRLNRFFLPLRRKVVYIDHPAPKRPGHQKKIATRVVDEAKKDRRIELISQFPALASHPDLFAEDTLKFLDRGDSAPEDVAAHLWMHSARGKPNKSVIEHMRGKNEADIGAAAARNLAQMLVFLNDFEPEQYPDSPQQWRSFYNVVQADIALTQDGIRLPGQTLQDLSRVMPTPGDWHALEEMLMPEGNSLRAVRDIRRLVRRIGAAVVFEALDAAQMTHGLDMGEESLLWLAAPPDERLAQKVPSGIRHALTMTGGRNLASFIYGQTPTDILLRWSQQFLTHMDQWDEWQANAVIQRNIVGYAAEQKWLPLPDPKSDPELQDKMREWPLIITPVSGADDMMKAAREIRSWEAMDLAEAAIFNPTHVVRLSDKRTGETKCLARLRESQGEDAPLTLMPDGLICPNDDRKTLKYLDNEITAAVLDYLSVVNQRRLNASAFERGRRQAQQNTLRARRIVDITGAERGDVQARIQRLDILGNYLPPGFTTRNEVTGAISHELFDRVVRLAKARDGRSADLQEELWHYALVDHGRGTVGVYEHLPVFSLDAEGALSWNAPEKTLPFVGREPEPIRYMPRPHL